MNEASEIVRICLYEFRGDRAQARKYCERIAAQNGPLSADYRDAARILEKETQ